MNILTDHIQKVERSVVAIGFIVQPDKINIIGSGFFIGDKGEILSAAHLYSKSKPKDIPDLLAMVMVGKDENEIEKYRWFPLELINQDQKNDVALFRIKNFEQERRNHLEMNLGPLKLGDSELIRTGEDVYFIGFPYAAMLMNDGFGVTRIVNKGIISNIKRDGIKPSHERNWFILDAISNPGNSGCPLLKIGSNEVIGIMTISFRKRSESSPGLDIREPMHISAAKPINLAKPLLKGFGPV